jgi:hypothetical protein
MRHLRSSILDQNVGLTINLSAWSEWSSGSILNWQRNGFEHVAFAFKMKKNVDIADPRRTGCSLRCVLCDNPTLEAGTSDIDPLYRAELR